MACTFFHFVLKRWLLPVSLIRLCFTFCGSKGGIHLLALLLFPITQDLFLAKFLARIRGWKLYLTFAATSLYWASYQRVDLPTTRLLLKPLINEDHATPVWILAGVVVCYVSCKWKKITVHYSHYFKSPPSRLYVQSGSAFAVQPSNAAQMSDDWRLFAGWHCYHLLV